MRDEPVTGESVDLVVRAAPSTDLDALETAVEATGATVDRRLQFDSLQITADQDRLEALCDLAGIESIETAAVIEFTGDAGEDFGDGATE